MSEIFRSLSDVCMHHKSDPHIPYIYFNGYGINFCPDKFCNRKRIIQLLEIINDKDYEIKQLKQNEVKNNQIFEKLCTGMKEITTSLESNYRKRKREE